MDNPNAVHQCLKTWKCESCAAPLAVVNDHGEAWFTGRVILRATTAVVLCPECGAPNVWGWHNLHLTDCKV
jgi:hypothetical protein